LNSNLKKVEGISLAPDMYGYWHHKDFMYTATLSDLYVRVNSIVDDKNLPESIRKAYEKVNATDASGWAFLPAYREMLHKAGGRFSKKQEQLFQYVTAQDRLLMAEDGLLPGYEGTPLHKADLRTIAKGIPKNATFQIIKPIATGVTPSGTTVLDKYSLAPLSYSLVRGTDMVSVYLKMW